MRFFFDTLHELVGDGVAESSSADAVEVRVVVDDLVVLVAVSDEDELLELELDPEPKAIPSDGSV